MVALGKPYCSSKASCGLLFPNLYSITTSFIFSHNISSSTPRITFTMNVVGASEYYDRHDEKSTLINKIQEDINSGEVDLTELMNTTNDFLKLLRNPPTGRTVTPKGRTPQTASGLSTLRSDLRAR